MATPAQWLEAPETAPSPAVRQAVRDLLLSCPSYHGLEPAQRRDFAAALVKVCQAGVSLIEEEAKTDAIVGPPTAAPGASRPVLAMAQTAGQQYSGVSAERVAGTTRAILNAVSFPRFVTELINGVFKALVDSSQQQMHSYVELIRNVAATTEGFADLNMAPSRARQWLADTFPGSFQLEGGSDNSENDGTPPDPEDQQDNEPTLTMKEGGTMPSEAALRAALSIAPGETIPSGDPESALLPFARRALARQRQGMLATMVMLGMQRIVVESGRLNAAMRFHIDTRSAAASEDSNRLNFENRTEAEGKLGFGPWGLDAKMTNTIGYVSTQKNQSSEEMNTDLDLNSSVELYFKTDYLPLERMAGQGQVDRIKVNTLNPDAEARSADQAREARTSAARAAESARFGGMDSPAASPATATAPAAPAPRPQTPAAGTHPPAGGAGATQAGGAGTTPAGGAGATPAGGAGTTPAGGAGATPAGGTGATPTPRTPAGGTATAAGANPPAAGNASTGTRRPYPGRLIQEGARGPDVTAIQQRVGAKADGIFGPATSQAVMRYQRQHSLNADGIVGPSTWAVLFGS